MTFHFVTLFPELIRPWLTSSILGIALKNGVFQFKTYQLRDFSHNKRRSVDDHIYGGGTGMVLRVEPLVHAVEHIQNTTGKRGHTICFSARGKRLNVELIEHTLAQPETDYILICGHYEGIDQRFFDGWVDSEVSLGDLIVSGGELPALAFTDAVIRHQEGALPALAAREESFSFRYGASRLLEYPHYTRPRKFRHLEVPAILLSGDHQAIGEWRHQCSVQYTTTLRPDLLKIDKESQSSS